MNIKSSLVDELRDKQYREAFVASQIGVGIPFQIRAIRQSREMTQPELARAAGMSQPRISEIENPGARNLNLQTLLRIAAAFDVALEVRFLSFGEFIDRVENIDPNSIEIDSFEVELAKKAFDLAQREVEIVPQHATDIAQALEEPSRNGKVYVISQHPNHPDAYKMSQPLTGAYAALAEGGSHAAFGSTSR